MAVLGLFSSSTIKEEASKRGMSPSTLSAHLKDFENKLVNRRVDITKYPPRVYYSRMRSSPGLTDKILLVSQNKLTKLLKSGTNTDELLKAVDLTVMG
jgi:DNA-binding HxlR family transcriptional regulator